MKESEPIIQDITMTKNEWAQALRLPTWGMMAFVLVAVGLFTSLIAAIVILGVANQCTL